MLIEFICEKQEEKLLRLISLKYPELSFNKINMLLRKRDIRINGKKVQDNVFVRKNDTVQLYVSNLEDKKNTNINIYYEDSNILVAEKPQDIEVEGANSLTEHLKNDYDFLKPCHRLDRNTTGLLVYALNEKAYGELLKAFNERTIEKYYLALLCGYMEQKKARLNAYLFKDSRKSKVYISDKQGKGYLPITTEYRVLQEFNDLSLVEVNLITGRTHQIRAHMAYIGYPVLGDGKYGSNDINKAYGAKNQQLYAYKIKFNFLQNSALKYLNDIEFDNRLYEKDLQEFNASSEADTTTYDTLPEVTTSVKIVSEIDEFIKSNGGGDGRNYTDKRFKNKNRNLAETTDSAIEIEQEAVTYSEESQVMEIKAEEKLVGNLNQNKENKNDNNGNRDKNKNQANYRNNSNNVNSHNAKNGNNSNNTNNGNNKNKSNNTNNGNNTNNNSANNDNKSQYNNKHNEHRNKNANRDINSVATNIENINTAPQGANNTEKVADGNKNAKFKKKRFNNHKKNKPATPGV